MICDAGGSLNSIRFYAGDDLLSRWTHYHRPQVLIGRVRDGNGSFHLGMVTGNFRSGEGREMRGEARGGVSRLFSPLPIILHSRNSGPLLATMYGSSTTRVMRIACLFNSTGEGRWLCWPLDSRPSSLLHGGRDGAVKRLAVSTGPLNVSPHVHVRPIDPVVFREPSSYEGRPDLGGSFALICLQRLSVPYVATQRCR